MAFVQAVLVSSTLVNCALQTQHKECEFLFKSDRQHAPYNVLYTTTAMQMKVDLRNEFQLFDDCFSFEL